MGETSSPVHRAILVPKAPRASFTSFLNLPLEELLLQRFLALNPSSPVSGYNIIQELAQSGKK
jgi:hypothetical protein